MKCEGLKVTMITFFHPFFLKLHRRNFIDVTLFGFQLQFHVFHSVFFFSSRYEIDFFYSVVLDNGSAVNDMF